jgi:hypothetical protein
MDRREIKNELKEIKYAINQEIQDFKRKEEKIDRIKMFELHKQAEKAKLILGHLIIMRKLHEKQAELHREFLNWLPEKFRGRYVY